MRPVPARRQTDFGSFVRGHGGAGRLVVQPRTGFDDPAAMRAALLATKHADATTVGTITLDSYTRVGDLDSVRTALRAGTRLNGYPIVSHAQEITAAVLDGVRDETFPVQVRHGSAAPRDIFGALAATGVTATEGGPVSYCLPYGRTPLAASVRDWTECARAFAALGEPGVRPHVETFGGCLLGQLCPPSQLVAVSVLEAMFFRSHGVASVSASYAQQTSADQDVEAVFALRRLCAELLSDTDWHVVVYAYMGLYPATGAGSRLLLDEAARLALRTGSERLIVKTVAESRRIPTIAENVAALERAGAVRADPLSPGPADTQTYAEARALVDTVLDLDDDLGRALLTAFRGGLLDIPYCLHPDNAGRARGYVDGDGRLRWAELGSLPLRRLVSTARTRPIAAAGLLADLSYVRRTYDRPRSAFAGTRLAITAEA
jgi:methylaspartate mutase epsilon subunit